jgi:hypothetical protein
VQTRGNWPIVEVFSSYILGKHMLKVKDIRSCFEVFQEMARQLHELFQCGIAWRHEQGGFPIVMWVNDNIKESFYFVEFFIIPFLRTFLLKFNWHCINWIYSKCTFCWILIHIFITLKVILF